MALRPRLSASSHLKPPGNQGRWLLAPQPGCTWKGPCWAHCFLRSTDPSTYMCRLPARDLTPAGGPRTCGPWSLRISGGRRVRGHTHSLEAQPLCALRAPPQDGEDQRAVQPTQDPGWCGHRDGGPRTPALTAGDQPWHRRIHPASMRGPSAFPGPPSLPEARPQLQGHERPLPSSLGPGVSGESWQAPGHSPLVTRHREGTGRSHPNHLEASFTSGARGRVSTDMRSPQVTQRRDCDASQEWQQKEAFGKPNLAVVQSSI